MKKRKINKRKLFALILILLLVIALGVYGVYNFILKGGERAPKGKKLEAKIEAKVDIVNLDSKTRPLAVSINNTPVAVKVQTGLNKAFLVYEIPTEGSTSRILAVYKDVESTKVGTIRSARHNMIDFSLESGAIFVAFGWSHYAQDDLQKKHVIDYVQGIVSEGNMWRENPAHLDSEHTVYLQTDKVYDYARDRKNYSLESDSSIVLKYNVVDVDLSDKKDNKVANTVTIPYGSVTTVFRYNAETGMYTRVVNDRVATDYFTGEEFTTKNIIIQRLTYNRTSDGYYWNLNTVSNGDGYYITNGYAIPIVWSKDSRGAKTKYMTTDGDELEVSDGRTYIEVQVTSKNSTIE